MRSKIFAISVLCGVVAGGYEVGAQLPPDVADVARHRRMLQGLTDAQFPLLMIQHQQHGMEIAQREENSGASGELKSLAARIRQSQVGDIAELKKHAISQRRDANTGASDAFMQNDRRLTMDRLRSVSGTDLDQAFIHEMSRHNQLAIDVIESAKLQNAGLKALADRILARQRQELTQLNKFGAERSSGKGNQ